MITFNYLEDYLELIAGYGRKNLPHIVVNLARYDVKIVASLAEQTSSGTPLTDKQGALVHKIVCKYHRQLSALDIDVSPMVDNPAYRMALRIIDRTKRLYFDDNQLVLKFPFEKDLVNEVTQAAKVGNGRYYFDSKVKEWKVALTEDNVSWAMTIAKKYDFEITPKVQVLMDLVTECEKTPYKIELIQQDSGYAITNAEPSLVEYIEANLGGFGSENLLNLVDQSSILGYTVSKHITQGFIDKYSVNIADLMTHRVCHIKEDSVAELTAVKLIAEYAELTNRWPVYIYHPELHGGLLTAANEVFGEDNVTTNLKQVDNPGTKCVYLKKVTRAASPKIPLMLTTMSMLHGDKRWMVLSVEKVIYYTPTTFTTEAKQIAG
jgi:hypothetical protein